ncbi:TIGR04255 family protein, partial [Pseudonocardia petroleophila]
GSDFRGETTGSVVGYCYVRDDEARKVFVKLDGFAFSWVGNYENWTNFQEEVGTHWARFLSQIVPKSVDRVGVRYINRIDVAGRHIEISDYLRTNVNLSPYLPQMIAGYYLQVQVPVQKYDGIATITSTIAPPGKEDELSLVLDIDCWRATRIVEDFQEDGDLWTALADLRLMKNYVFEACITDATRGLIS